MGTGTDDRLFRMDARTGAARGSVPSGLPGAQVISPAAGGDLYAFKRPDEAARLDGRTGAAIWHRDLGGTIGPGDTTADLVWIHLTPAGQRDRLVRLDPATGETLATVPLDSFGASGVLAIDGEIWLEHARRSDVRPGSGHAVAAPEVVSGTGEAASIAARNAAPVDQPCRCASA